MKRLLFLIAFIAATSGAFASVTDPKILHAPEECQAPSPEPPQPCMHCDKCNGVFYCVTANTCAGVLEQLLKLCEKLGCC